jgi:plastocyanin
MASPRALFLVLAGIASLSLGGAAERSFAAEGVLEVRAGAGEPGFAINEFLPENVTVHVGETIRWSFPWHEPHSVTFGVADSGAPPSTPSPATHSGQSFLSSDLTFGPGKSYDIRFTTAGTFAYNCYIHPRMLGTVTVVPAGAIADSQQSADLRAAAEYRHDIEEIRAIAVGLANQPVPTVSRPDGTTAHFLKIAGETAHGDVQQFFPATISVRQGDTITWRSVVHTPHTVTFGPFPPGLVVPDNPLIAEPAMPGTTYEGQGYWNSGVIGIDWPAGIEFSVTFSRPGSYRYYCTLHDSQGMVGIVTVLGPPVTPSANPSPTPEPPGAGTGTPPNEREFGWPLVVLAAGALLAAGAITRRAGK